MKKKALAILCLLVFVCCSNYSLADDEFDEGENESVDDVIETSVAAGVEQGIEINSRIAIAYDRASGRAIWGKNENKKTAMASTTKILTALITIENANLDDIVTVSRKAACTGGSRLGLHYEDKISVSALLFGLMLRSGNDCAVALAEHVGGSVENFANLMNQKANELGLRNTHFVTPHGLDDPNHYTTAFELAKIADYALRNETFAKIVATKNSTILINGRATNINNTNELLGNYPGVYGVKTGFTNNAGRCLVTAVKNDKLDIITVVLQADTKKDRTRDSLKIIKQVFNLYESIDINALVCEEFDNWLEINSSRINVNRAKSFHINIERNDVRNSQIVIEKSRVKDVKILINAVYQFEAPVHKHTKIGEIKVVVGDELIEIVDIYIESEIKRKDFMDYLGGCFLELAHIL